MLRVDIKMTLFRFALLVHLISASVVMGIVFFSLVFSVSKPLDEIKLKAISFIRKFGLYATGLTVISGVYMAYRHWDELSSSPLFWTKIILIGLDYFIAVRLINAKVASGLSGDLNSTRGLTVLTWGSFIAFIAIFTIGRIYL
ncbi:MAG: hypothetical protein AAB613_03020 [Patescibacteria group bacterium]